jgi:hypothetical protein
MKPGIYLTEPGNNLAEPGNNRELVQWPLMAAIAPSAGA